MKYFRLWCYFVTAGAVSEWSLFLVVLVVLTGAALGLVTCLLNHQEGTGGVRGAATPPSNPHLNAETPTTAPVSKIYKKKKQKQTKYNFEKTSSRLIDNFYDFSANKYNNYCCLVCNIVTISYHNNMYIFVYIL